MVKRWGAMSRSLLDSEQQNSKKRHGNNGCDRPGPMKSIRIRFTDDHACQFTTSAKKKPVDRVMLRGRRRAMPAENFSIQSRQRDCNEASK